MLSICSEVWAYDFNYFVTVISVYVASVFPIELLRKFELEQKMEVYSSFLLSSQLSRRSRAKTLAMRAIIALISWPLKITKMAEIRFLD